MQTGQLHSFSMPHNIVLLPGMYNESMQMLTDAHEYFFLFSASDQEIMPPEFRVIYLSEMSRITMRLSSIMGWLLVRRAVHSGKINEQTASQHYPLAFQEICLLDLGDLKNILPEHMSTLLVGSLELYKRILRLQQQLTAQH